MKSGKPMNLDGHEGAPNPSKRESTCLIGGVPRTCQTSFLIYIAFSRLPASPLLQGLDEHLLFHEIFCKYLSLEDSYVPHLNGNI